VTAPLQKHRIPNIDVAITENALIILVELAGLRKDNLNLTIEGNRLLISGIRPEHLETNPEYVVNEIHIGPFDCVIDVPADYDLRGKETRAGYRNGFLRIRVQRRQSSDPTLGASATLEPTTEAQVAQLVVSHN